MSLTRLTCPSCNAVLTTDKPVAPGKSIRCPRCKETFAAPAAKETARDAERPSKPSARAPEARPERPASRRSASAPLRPKAIKRDWDDDDDDFDDEDDDFDERPRRRRRPESSSSFPIVPVLVVGGAMVMLLIAALVAGSWYYFHKKGPQFVEQSAKPVAFQPMAVNQPAVSSHPVSREDWLQDLDAAKRQAAAEKKDLLIFFDGSDWSKLSKELSEKFLMTSRFRDIVRDTFIFVLIDFPETPAGKAKVADAARNEKLAQTYGIAGFPTVLLADDQGRPYAAVGYVEGDMTPDGYAQACVDHQAERAARDGYFGNIARSQGMEKAQAAAVAAHFLLTNSLLGCYAPEMQEWLKLARDVDPKNEHGLYERLFMDDYLRQLETLDPDKGDEMLRCVAQLDDWKKTHKFKDQDIAVYMHLIAGHYLATAGKVKTALTYLKQAEKYKESPRFKHYLERAQDTPFHALGISSGSGFMIADGIMMTNHHVVKGGGRIMVRLPKQEEPVAAEVIADDEKRDMALIRLKSTAGLALKPLNVAGDRTLDRGEQVAAFGFPLGDQYGAGLKLTTGDIAGLPEPGNENMLLLTTKVNPGNSGGPLCDSFGNVVGMVSAKSTRNDVFRAVESYGMAIPAADLQAFIAKHIKGYKHPAASAQKKPWNEVDHMVSGSVFMVLKPESKLETSFGGHLTLEPRKH